jgi:hypothetical protein
MRTEQRQWSSRAGWGPKSPGILRSSAQLVLVFGDASTADRSGAIVAALVPLGG